MQYRKFSVAALAIGYAALTVSPALAFDIGGSKGLSVNSSGGGLSVSLGGSKGVNANVGTSGGLGVNASVGGSSGVNANVGVSGSSGVGVNASVGGSGGIGTSASLGGKSGGGLGTGVNASVGGTQGVNANVNAGLDQNGVSARTTAGLGGRTLLDIMLGLPGTGVNPGTPDPGPNPTNPRGPNARNNDRARTQLAAFNDMSAAERTKMKIRCRDVIGGGGGFDPSLVKLCKMVLSMR